MLLALPISSAADTDDTTVLSEDFEGTWSGPLPGGWISDRSGTGYNNWTASSYASAPSGYAAWCGLSGQERYDTSTDSYMGRALSGLDSFSTVTLTFQYWTKTGESILTLGSDYLWVGIITSAASSPSDGVQQQVWRQPVANSLGWQEAEVSIPANTTWMVFNFHSGSAEPIGGPFIGVFVDDVLVSGSGKEAPVSRATSPIIATNQGSFDVTVEMVQHGDAVSYTQLYYRTDTAANFALYTTAGNPTGRWTTPTITFEAPADGRYEIFSLATDRWGSSEAMKTQSEVVVYVDHVSPSSIADISGQWGNGDWYVSAVQVNLTAWDFSDIHSITYRLDGGGWTEYGAVFQVAADGEHFLEYYATDRAGNKEDIRDATFWIDRTGPAIHFESAHGGNVNPGGSVGFTVADDDSGVELVEFSVDGGAYERISDYSGTISLAGLANGSHVIALRAWDQAGNQQNATLKVTVADAGIGGGLSSILAAIVVAALTILALGAILHLSRRRS